MGANAIAAPFQKKEENGTQHKDKNSDKESEKDVKNDKN